jgi:hypothetical protein
VFVSASCDALGFHLGRPHPGNEEQPQTVALSIQGGLRPTAMSDAIAGGMLTVLPRDPVDEGSAFWRAGLEGQVRERGCRNPAFDSAGSHQLTGLGGLILRGDAAASVTSPNEWELTQRASGSSKKDPQPWHKRPLAEGGNPCADGCRTTDDSGRQQTFSEEGFGLGWVKTALPPGGLEPGPIAEQFAADPLYTFHEQHNAGVESVWCRRIAGASLSCVTSRTGIEFHDDWSAVDERSRSGRFLFYSNGFGPYQVFDVVAMRHVTPAGSKLTSRPGAATFSNGQDDGLFVFVDSNRMMALEPDANGRFVDISGSLSWQGRLAETGATNPVIGVVSPSPAEIVAVAENGLLLRFDWRTGRIIWSRQVTGIGKVLAVRRAPAATFTAVVGEWGIRVVRTRDGLITSGALLPGYLFDPAFDVEACRDVSGPIERLTEVMTDVEVDGGGALTVSCGDARYQWSATPFTGDIVRRLEALVAPSR